MAESWERRLADQANLLNDSNGGPVEMLGHSLRIVCKLHHSLYSRRRILTSNYGQSTLGAMPKICTRIMGGTQARPSGGPAQQRLAHSLTRYRILQCRPSSARSQWFACRAVAPSMGDDVATTKRSVSSSAGGDSATLTFQDAISKLQEYWASVGCALWLPHNTEVGAGTMNPATFLRVLGPEPWNVAYAEPSIRPDDSRYGDNPNRVQRHTQFQVILKPDPVRCGASRPALLCVRPLGALPISLAMPRMHICHRQGNPQELYLKSLEAIGIDTKVRARRYASLEHVVRVVCITHLATHVAH